MQTRDAYNNWSGTYDIVENKTRDLEAKAIRSILKEVQVDHILEIGCGTGKNTVWLVEKCNQLTAVDFSKEMLQIAQQKLKNNNIVFTEADITKPWAFSKVDLITCSLVLEHIEDLGFIFNQAASKLSEDGLFYIGELHPYKQLKGSRAKFEQEGTVLHLEYFIHHISDYIVTAKQAGFICTDLQEWFDGDRNETPRLVSYLLKKNRSLF